MITIPPNITVYLQCGNTDMRKSINGLSSIVEESIKADPFSGSLFAFCNRNRNLVKILYWDRNGFCIWYKRFEKHKLCWPKNKNDAIRIRSGELQYLLDGLDLKELTPHEELNYKICC